MLRIAVITRYFPSSAEPWQGRSAYQTLRVLAQQADVEVFYPNAAYPRFLKPRTRIYTTIGPPASALDVKATYYDYFALPLLSRPFNGWMAARALPIMLCGTINSRRLWPRTRSAGSARHPHCPMLMPAEWSRLTLDADSRLG